MGGIGGIGGIGTGTGIMANDSSTASGDPSAKDSSDAYPFSFMGDKGGKSSSTWKKVSEK